MDQEWDLKELQQLRTPLEPTEYPDSTLMQKLLPYATSEDSITNSAVLSFLYLFSCLSRGSRYVQFVTKYILTSFD